jgi:hypothetical protein
MPSSPARFKPDNTMLVRCETEIAFDCDEAPQRVDDTPYGLVGLGFIFASKYEIKTSVLSFVREPCYTEGCIEGIRYRGKLLVRVSETFGIGFGLGKGTVALGYTARQKRSEAPFVTDCICCEDEPRPKRASVTAHSAQSSPALDVIATTLAGSAIAAGLAFAHAYPSSALGHYFEMGVYGLTGLALAWVVLHAVIFGRAGSTSDDEPSSTPTARAARR